MGAQGAQGPVQLDWSSGGAGASAGGLASELSSGSRNAHLSWRRKQHGQKVPELRAQSPSTRTGTAAPLRPLRSQPFLLPARILPYQALALDLLSELVFPLRCSRFLLSHSPLLTATPLTWRPVLPLPFEPSLSLHGTPHSRDTGDWTAKPNTAAEFRSVKSLST